MRPFLPTRQQSLPSGINPVQRSQSPPRTPAELNFLRWPWPCFPSSSILFSFFFFSLPLGPTTKPNGDWPGALLQLPSPRRVLANSSLGFLPPRVCVLGLFGPHEVSGVQPSLRVVNVNTKLAVRKPVSLSLSERTATAKDVADGGYRWDICAWSPGRRAGGETWLLTSRVESKALPVGEPAWSVGDKQRACSDSIPLWYKYHWGGKSRGRNNSNRYRPTVVLRRGRDFLH